MCIYTTCGVVHRRKAFAPLNSSVKHFSAVYDAEPKFTTYTVLFDADQQEKKKSFLITSNLVVLVLFCGSFLQAFVEIPLRHSF